VLLLLSTLGIAIGLGSATAGGIWGALCVIIAFFAGGWFAGRTLDMFDSTVAGSHGLLTWAVSLVFTLIFVIAAGFLGINALANAFSAIPLHNLLGIAAISNANGANAAAAASNAATSSWIAFFVLLLSVLAAVFGAIVGNRSAFANTAPR
jgi:hypothetical protein